MIQWIYRDFRQIHEIKRRSRNIDWKWRHERKESHSWNMFRYGKSVQKREIILPIKLRELLDEAEANALCCRCEMFLSRSVVSDSLWHHGPQNIRHRCPSPSPGVCSESRTLSRCCHPTISVVKSKAKIIGVNEQLVNGVFITILFLTWIFQKYKSPSEKCLALYALT